MLAVALLIAGLLAVVAGVALLSVPAAVITAGVMAVTAGVLLIDVDSIGRGKK